MWTFIIVVIVIFFGKFLIDCAKQSNSMKSQGGMRTKYAILIKQLLDNPNARVIQETSTFINICASSIGGTQAFMLQQTFGSISIQLHVKNNPVFKDFIMEWTFPENMSQELMLKKINDDMLLKMQTEIRQ